MLAFLEKHMYQEALQEGIAFFEQMGVPEENLAELRSARPKEGLKRLWEWQLRALQRQSEDSYVSAYIFAVHYAVLERNEEALEWLEKALDERTTAIVYLGVDPSFDALRSEPHFQKLLKRLKLPLWSSSTTG